MTSADSAASTRAGSTWTLAAVAFCFLLSGFAALLYQTAWLRQFSIVFGTSDLAVVTVLAAYMGGLAVGAAIAGRFAGRVRRPILVYGLLEGGIAVTAVAVPLLLSGAGLLYVAVLGGQSDPPDAATFGQPLFYLAAGFVVLALPTGLMGATLPLLARYAVRTDREMGPRVAWLYAINTAGAVAGTLMAAFVLLPALGLRGTVWVGVAVNAVVFGAAALLARVDGGAGADPAASGPAPRTGFFAACVRPLITGTGSFPRRLAAVCTVQPAWMLPLMLASGAAAFLYEVLWTRMLSHVLGGSIYAFATMLAAFLIGIALGSAAAGAFAGRRERAAAAFIVAQIAIACLSAGVYEWMQALVPDTRDAIDLAMYAVLVMLPATIFIGATFPLAVRVVGQSERDVGAATAAVYAWNTLGAIAGAVLAGFVVIPALGFEGAVKLGVLVNLGCAAAGAAFIARRTPARLAVACGMLALVAVLYAPVRPMAVVGRPAFGSVPTDAGRELYFAVGRSATVLLREINGTFELRTNGLPEAAVQPRGSPPDPQSPRWLAALAVAARPAAETMLVVGFGGGIALEGLPPSVRAVDVIELEPEVIAANRVLSEARAIDPLADPRVNLVINDARNALRLTEKRYDLIVSQPSHPWTAGASHLFTREFIELGKARLEQDGVLLQWMSASFVDEPLLRSLAATLAGAFRNVRLYQSGPSLFFLASDGALDIERRLAATGRPLGDNLLYYSYLGLNGVEDFLVALALDEQGVAQFASGAPSSTDDRNRMATDSRAFADGLDSPTLTQLLAPHDALLDPESWIHSGFGRELNFGYVALRLLVDGRGQRAALLEQAVRDASDRALIAGMLASARGDPDAARSSVLEALTANSRNADAAFTVVQPYLPALAGDAAPEQVRALAATLPSSATAVVRGWALAAQEDWAGLANLDRALAGARTTDLWFPDASKLRAEWRAHAVGDERYATDALRLIDRVLAVRPSFDALMVRAVAARSGNDGDALAETARALASSARLRLEAAGGADALPAAERRVMVQSLEWLANGLEAVPSRGGADVRQGVAELLARFAAAN